MTVKAGALGGVLPSGCSPKEQHRSLSTTAPHLCPLWKKGFWHQPPTFFVPKIYSFYFSRKCAAGFGNPKCLSLDKSSPNSRKHIRIYPIYVFYACDVVAGVILTTKNQLFAAQIKLRVALLTGCALQLTVACYCLLLLTLQCLLCFPLDHVPMFLTMNRI